MKRRFQFVILMLMLLVVCSVTTGCFGGLFKKNKSPKNEVVEIYFERDYIQLEIGTTQQLEILFVNNNVSNKKIEWSSTDSSCVSVDENGVITGNIPGVVSITATSASGDQAYISVACVKSPTSITLDKTTHELFATEEFELVATLAPADITETDIAWRSSDSEIARVDDYGRVEAKKAGTVTISATTTNGLVASCEVVVKPYVKVVNVVLDKSGYTAIIPYNEDIIEFDLKGTAYPKNASYPEISWYSDNEAVAVVDQNGHVTVIGSGTVRIHARTKDNIEASCYITAKKEIIASAIRITPNLTFYEGENSKSISTSWTPSNTTYKSLTWSTSDESVATVENGRVTPHSIGTATITATSKHGLTATCIVTVNAKVEASSVILSSDSISVEETFTHTLTATVLPENTSVKTITWKSLDETIATVSNNGVVTGVKTGQTKITATTENNITAECLVQVTEFRVLVTAYINEQEYAVLETTKSKDYVVEIPGKLEDITTNQSLTNYFHGWFSDVECTQKLSSTARFEKHSAIYARNIEISDEGFEVNTLNMHGPAIRKYNNPNNTNVVVVPTHVRGHKIKAVQSGAFDNDDNLINIVFVENLIVADRAITNCSKLENIMLHTDCDISSDSIYKCANVKYNNFGGGYYLGTYEKPYLVAVNANTRASEITIAKDCVRISDVFNSLEKLEKFNVEQGNLRFSEMSGILYNLEQTKIEIVPALIAGEISIPSTMQKIEDNCFERRELITSIDFGGNLVEIGAQAFYLCRSLAQISGLESLRVIKESAFNNCAFTELALPKSLTEIGFASFGGNRYLESITIPFVGHYASATIESSTKYPIGYIFGDSEYFESVKAKQTYYYGGELQTSDYYLPKTLKKITLTGGQIFYGAFSNIPNNIDVVIANGISTIETNSFKGATLNNLTLPTSVSSIGDWAFEMSALKNLYFEGNLENWLQLNFNTANSNPAYSAEKVYFNNVVVNEINIPNHTTEIKNYMFYNFKHVETILLHNNITSIGNGAFAGTQIKSIDFSEKLENIGASAFANCKSLESVEIGQGIILGNSAFAGCVNLKTAILPNDLETIPSRLFENCASLIEINIPSSVTQIQSYAFSNCSSITTFNVPHKDVVLGSDVIGGCASLESITLSSLGATTSNNSADDVLAYYFTNESFSEGYEVTQYHSANYEKSYLPKSLTSVTILNGALGREAFANCTYISEVKLEKDVTVFGVGAFNGCVNLHSLNIQSTSILDMANHNYTFTNAGRDQDVLTITFGKHVENIPSYFMSSNSNTQIEIVFEAESQCSTIGERAFANANIREISIPASVSNIEDNVFYKCNILNILVDENNQNYADVNGNLFNKNKNVLIQYAIGKTDTEFEISSNISTITPYAFDGATNLNHIIYSTNEIDNLTSYNHVLEGVGEDDGFKITFRKQVLNIPSYLCNPKKDVGANLIGIVFEDESECVQIGEYAFANCLGLTKIDLPKKLASIKNFAFLNCENIETVNFIGGADSCAIKSYETIESNPMYYAENYTIDNQKLSVLTISSSVDKIGKYAFYKFKDATKITLPNTIITIGEKAFNDCSNVTELFIPTGYYSQAGLLKGCSSLQTLQIPRVGVGNTSVATNKLFGFVFGEEEFDNATEIWQRANPDDYATYKHYYIPNDLTHVKISSGDIYSGAFALCDNIKTIELSDTITTIQDYAFSNCSSLEAINIDKVTSIGEKSFIWCAALSSVSISESIEHLGAYAFSGCKSLKEVNLTSPNLVNIPEGVFQNCENIKTIEFNENLTSIGNRAFQNCHGLRYMELSSELTTIGEHAFQNCYGIYSVRLYSKLESIGTYAFNGCYKLVEIFNLSKFTLKPKSGNYGSVAANAKIIHTLPGEASGLINIDDYIFLDNDGKKVLIACEKEEETLTLPTTEFNYTINGYAFINSNVIKNVTIPSCVVGLDSNVFYKCSNLDYLSITSKTTSFKTELMQDSATLSKFNYVGTQKDWFNIEFESVSANPMHFANEFNLNGEVVTEFTIPDTATEINPHTFYNFKELKAITIPNKIVKISDGAFKNCTSLQTMQMSDQVQTVGAEAFRNCMALTAINLPNKVTSIGNYAFYDCMNLEEFKIPTSLTKITEYMLGNCSALEEIEILNNITQIDPFAFWGCSKVSTFNIPNSVTLMGDGLFGNCESIQKIEIPFLVTIRGEEENKSLCDLFSAHSPSDEDKFDAVSQPGTFGFVPLSLSSITIRTGEIEKGAFVNCEMLETVTLQDVWRVAEEAFTLNSPHVEKENGIYYVDKWIVDCQNSLESIVARENTVGIAEATFKGKGDVLEFNAPETLKYIGSQAFKDCALLETLTFSNVTETIGDEAFYGCSKISNINLPKTLTYFGYQALYGCSLLTEIAVEIGCENYVTIDGALYDADLTTLIKYPAQKKSALVLPNSVERIEDYALMDAKITSFKEGESLRVIGKGAFYNAPYLGRLDLKENNITILGEYSFYNCKNLYVIFIGDNLKEIGAHSFENCDRLFDEDVSGVSFQYSSAWYVYKENSELILTTLSTFYDLTTENLAKVYCKNKWVRKSWVA